MTEKTPARITACPGGPLLIRGEVEIVGDDGEAIRSPRRTIALCRCGASAIKPWCDGTHKLIRFTTVAERSAAGHDGAAARSAAS